MLSNFRHWVYTDLVFGKDAEKSVGKELKRLGATKVLVHHDSGKFLYDTGLLEAIKGYLTEEGLEVVELGGVQPNPRLSLIYKGIELCKKEKIDFLLAIGGGSTMDSAKAIGIGLNYDGDVWDYYCGKAVINKMAPLAVVLTYPATGSESSTSSVVTNDLVTPKLKGSAGSMLIRPNISFLNPELTYTLPPYLTGCGVADMYAHIIERYFAPATPYGSMDYLCEGLLRALLVYGPKVIAQPDDYDTRAEIMWIGTVAHNNTVGVGRVQDWASHNIGHTLSAMYDTAHGATLAIVFPSWMTYVYKNDIPRFARYAKEVFGIDEKDPEKAALAGIAATKAFFKSLGVPTSFAEAKLPTDKIEIMAKQAAETGRGGVGNFVRLKEEDILAIFKGALV